MIFNAIVGSKFYTMFTFHSFFLKLLPIYFQVHYVVKKEFFLHQMTKLRFRSKNRIFPDIWELVNNEPFSTMFSIPSFDLKFGGKSSCNVSPSLNFSLLSKKLKNTVFIWWPINFFHFKTLYFWINKLCSVK